MSPLPIEIRIEAENLINELHVLAGIFPGTGHGACMTEAALLISNMMRVLSEPISQEVSPQSILQQAEAMITERGKRRDNGQERSMQRIVKTFEALTDHKMTEVEGWLFMVVLKLCRERTGSDIDNWIDGAAYMGLAAEAVEKMRGNPPSA